MTDHRARPGWPDGHRAYYWMLTFPDSSALISRARGCQIALAHLGMDRVPDDGLHVTMTRIGDIAQIQLLATLAKQRRLASFPMAVHPLAGSWGAVRFTLTAWTPLVHLHSALSELGHQTGVSGGPPTPSLSGPTSASSTATGINQPSP
ncbi:hypothetical protein [Streptomyces sp. NPDC005525]|uniref:hypothetical protein n=1 Tax=Streptomyces sp. NPDC005525 TaxID=3364720 RepID=UPI0036842C3B